jgi:hypothetical protein
MAIGSRAIDASHWKWYEFPTVYLGAHLADRVVGWWIGRR